MPDIFRRHQPHLVSVSREYPPEMVRAAAGFHRHPTRHQPLGEGRAHRAGGSPSDVRQRRKCHTFAARPIPS